MEELANSAITLESGEYFVLGDNQAITVRTAASAISEISVRSTLSGKFGLQFLRKIK